ncbi:hypothetical protein EOM86_07825, partial [Candidatus Nomurabacteria bacterium]|nr:hypothetical protein [Candidatus Nomurabacteria bacterium]
MSESYTLHSSLFDVVRTISLEISSDVNVDSDYYESIEGIGFEVPAVSVPDFGSLVMGLPPGVSIANPSSNLTTAEYLVFHKSVFGIYQDREVTIESSCIAESDFVYPVIQIHEYPESVLHPSSEIVTENYQAFHKSQFDIWKPFYATFAVQSVVPSVSDVSPVCCVSAESVAQTIINYPYLPVKQTITGNSDIVVSSDIYVYRGDYDIGCSLIASSVGITAEYVAAKRREIKFGSFVLPHSERKSEDDIKPIYNDRFNRLSNVNGVFSRTRAYERTITIHGETNKRIEYDQLHDQIGPKKALSVYGFYFPDCELSGLDITQRKPGLDRYPYTATFIQRVFDTQDSASFAGLEFSNVVSVSDIKKSRISDDKYEKVGIAEP